MRAENAESIGSHSPPFHPLCCSLLFFACVPIPVAVPASMCVGCTKAERATIGWGAFLPNTPFCRPHSLAPFSAPPLGSQKLTPLALHVAKA